jgi:hypothetical protein
MSARIAVAAAVNDRAVLKQCLASSPDIVSGDVALRTLENYPSASVAYNEALLREDADIIIFAHQDVYLPHGFIRRVHQRLAELDAIAPDWAVAGVVGADFGGKTQGRAWSSGLQMMILGQGPLPAPVETLDEMIIIVRKSAGLRFDEKLPGFHLYAADIIQIAASSGRSTWVIDAPAIHHSRPVLNLGGSYSSAWSYMRRKWRDRLPLSNLVCPLTRSPFTLWKTDIRLRIRHRGRGVRPQPKSNPAEIAARLGFEG